MHPHILPKSPLHWKKIVMLSFGSDDDLGVFEVSQRAMMSIDAVLNNFKVSAGEILPKNLGHQNLRGNNSGRVFF
jgi:hypothetical protein